MRTAAAAAVLSLGAAASSVAGPLEVDWVAADARWLVHADVEHFRDSSVGRFLLEHGDALDLDLDELRELEGELGLDPLRDALGVIVYGRGGEPGEDAVIVAVTNRRADDALQRLHDHEQIELRTIEAGGHVMQVLADGPESFYVQVARIGPDLRRVVCSQRRASMLRALDVIDRRRPGLARHGPLLAGGPRPGSIVFLAARDVAGLREIQPASEILRLSEGLTLDIGETGGVLAAEASLAAQDAETARSIVEVVEGMVALGRLIARQDPQLAPLNTAARAIDVSTRDGRIRVGFQCETQGLLDELEEAIAPRRGRDR